MNDVPGLRSAARDQRILERSRPRPALPHSGDRWRPAKLPGREHRSRDLHLCTLPGAGAPHRHREAGSLAAARFGAATAPPRRVEPIRTLAGSRASPFRGRPGRVARQAAACFSADPEAKGRDLEDRDGARIAPTKGWGWVGEGPRTKTKRRAELAASRTRFRDGPVRERPEVLSLAPSGGAGRPRDRTTRSRRARRRPARAPPPPWRGRWRCRRCDRT